jgi:hypothetical protein
MSKQTRTTRTAAAPAVKPKKTLRQLFEERDRTRAGSKEEERAAEEILKTVFPDTNGR